MPVVNYIIVTRNCWHFMNLQFALNVDILSMRECRVESLYTLKVCKRKYDWALVCWALLQLVYHMSLQFVVYSTCTRGTVQVYLSVDLLIHVESASCPLVATSFFLFSTNVSHSFKCFHFYCVFSVIIDLLHLRDETWKVLHCEQTCKVHLREFGWQSATETKASLFGKGQFLPFTWIICYIPPG